VVADFQSDGNDGSTIHVRKLTLFYYVSILTC
jgi:hypothetical protein